MGKVFCWVLRVGGLCAFCTGLLLVTQLAPAYFLITGGLICYVNAVSWMSND